MFTDVALLTWLEYKKIEGSSPICSQGLFLFNENDHFFLFNKHHFISSMRGLVRTRAVNLG